MQSNPKSKEFDIKGTIITVSIECWSNEGRGWEFFATIDTPEARMEASGKWLADGELSSILKAIEFLREEGASIGKDLDVLLAMGAWMKKAKKGMMPTSCPKDDYFGI